MELAVFSDLESFWSAVGPYLSQDEAPNNLILAILERLRTAAPKGGGESPYLALVTESGAPVLVSLQTPPHNPIVTAGPDAALQLVVEDLVRSKRRLVGVHGPNAAAECFARAWEELTGGRSNIKMSQRIYECSRVVPPRPRATGVFRRMNEGDQELVLDWGQRFCEECGLSSTPEERRRSKEAVERMIASRTCWLWEDEDFVVSMASANGQTPNGIRISFVYTPPESRRRGYAMACVAALTEECLKGGKRYCFLYTDLANPVSNRIYQKIGYKPVSDAVHIEFSWRT